MVKAKGEVGFTALDQDWIFQFAFNAICSAEEQFDKPFVSLISELFPASMMGGIVSDEQVAEAARKIRFGDLRSLFRIGLEAHHPEMTDILAGSIIHDYGTAEALVLLGEATFASMGGDQSGNEKGGDESGNVKGGRKPRPKN